MVKFNVSPTMNFSRQMILATRKIHIVKHELRPAIMLRLALVGWQLPLAVRGANPPDRRANAPPDHSRFLEFMFNLTPHSCRRLRGS